MSESVKFDPMGSGLCSDGYPEAIRLSIGVSLELVKEMLSVAISLEARMKSWLSGEHCLHCATDAIYCRPRARSDRLTSARIRSGLVVGDWNFRCVTTFPAPRPGRKAFSCGKRPRKSRNPFEPNSSADFFNAKSGRAQQAFRPSDPLIQ
jgi:hypothetical protein